MPAADPFAPFRPSEQDRRGLARSVVLEELRDAAPARRAALVLPIALALFLIWAANAPVRETVSASGQVLPTEGIRPVQHLDGGIVRERLVGSGDAVQAGQPLIRLDDAALLQERGQLRARLAALDAGIAARLAFVRDDAQTPTPSPTDPGSAEQPADPPYGGLAELAIRRSERAAADGELALRTARRGVLRAERARLAAEIEGEAASRAQLGRELSILDAQLVDYNRALDGGVVRRLDRDRIAREVIALQRRISESRTREAGLEASKVEIDARAE
ncbi:MAG: hypothetical protein AAF192_07685, partial [Pseudomonadota bacterium]